MSHRKKYFGTDGIRNQVGQGMISPDKILKLGWAVGKVVKKHGGQAVMIGKDTRISGYMFESALEAGFIAAGLDVYLLGPMPTPAIAYLTQTFSADVGVVISASHNPYSDNGIKFFNALGQKLSDKHEFEVEQMFEEPIDVEASEKLGRAKRIDDAAGRYIEFCKSTFGSKQKKLEGLKMVLDCAHGATYHIAPSVFRELGAEISIIGTEPDGMNINKGCGATNLEALSEKVLEESADLGIAFDGDGDRVKMVDHLGKPVDGDQILYLLAMHSSVKPKGVVGTLMSNLGLENILEENGINFVRTDVGDRFVMEALLENNWNYGAEQSGHVLCLDKISTGDGIVAALQVLSILVELGESLNVLLSGLALYPQILINVKVKNPKDVLSDDMIQQVVLDAEVSMKGKGRVLIRPSGTEAVVRVLVEGETRKLIEPYANSLASLVRTRFS